MGFQSPNKFNVHCHLHQVLYLFLAFWLGEPQKLLEKSEIQKGSKPKISLTIDKAANPHTTTILFFVKNMG